MIFQNISGGFRRIQEILTIVIQCNTNPINEQFNCFKQLQQLIDIVVTCPSPVSTGVFADYYDVVKQLSERMDIAPLQLEHNKFLKVALEKLTMFIESSHPIQRNLEGENTNAVLRNICGFLNHIECQLGIPQRLINSALESTYQMETNFDLSILNILVGGSITATGVSQLITSLKECTGSLVERLHDLNRDSLPENAINLLSICLAARNSEAWCETIGSQVEKNHTSRFLSASKLHTDT